MKKIDKMYMLGVDELERVCSVLPNEGIVVLKGNLAMGKTTLVKQIAKHLGIKEEVTSPTFSIMHNYENKLYHYDIFNEKTEGFIRQGLYENLDKLGLHVIEWGDDEFEKLLDKMQYEYICINITKSDDSKRYYEVYTNV